MKCNTNMDVKRNNPVFNQDTAKTNTPSRGQFIVLQLDSSKDFSNSAAWQFHSLVKHRSVHRHALGVIALCTNDVTNFRPPLRLRQTKSNSVREVKEMYANGE